MSFPHATGKILFAGHYENEGGSTFTFEPSSFCDP